MEYVLSVEQSNASLQLSGNLDRESLKSDWWQVLSAAQKASLNKVEQLSVDLENASRADTAGLAWLINIARDANAHNIKVIFANVPTKLLNLADLSGAKPILQA